MATKKPKFLEDCGGETELPILPKQTKKTKSPKAKNNLFSEVIIMANKKSKKKNIKDSKKTPSFIPTKEEMEARAKATKLEMKRLGFKTLEEYIAYIDKNRGY